MKAKGRRCLPSLAVGIGICLIVGLIWFLNEPPEWERKAPVASVLPKSLLEASVFPPGESLACKACHEAEFADWVASQHAHANRLVNRNIDRPAFHATRTFREGLLATEVMERGGQMLVRQTGPDGDISTHQAVAVIGVAPLIQYLTPFPGGRLQVINPAFDPKKKDWFDIYQGEPRQAHEWGFWKNQGMNWNSQCAYCHVTDFEKNYNVGSDSYASKWKAMGISCTQCHGPMEGHAARPYDPARLSKEQIMASCASCHSRREELTGQFHAGENFDDHYRLVLPDLSDTYYPDGQVRDENFEYASFLGSKMGHAGVTCLDCHQAHSGKLKLPVENNAMCMSCHTPPGTNGATPIPDPVAHSHHGANSTGNRCVECHMPETTYMARDPRRDHGFTIPDPLLTKELGIPNACNRCHIDQTTEWAIEWSEKWYGQKLERPSRERARLVARARAGDSFIDQEVIKFYESEPNAAWRATLISLLEGRENRPHLADFLVSAFPDPSPYIRTAAIRSLGTFRTDILESALSDPSRSVRLAASWSLLMDGKTIPPEKRKEIREFLSNISDSPMGAFQQARLAAAENRLSEMNVWLERAIQRDPSAGLFQQAALLMVQVQRPAEARRFFELALKDQPDNAAIAYQLALLEAEMGNPSSAMNLLQKTVDLDPQFGRAWYNLGLAKAAAGDLKESVRALTTASELLPGDPDPSYALATVFAKLNDPKNAAAAAAQALRIDPDHEPAKNLLRSLIRPANPAK